MKKTTVIILSAIVTAAIVSISATKIKHVRANAPVTAESLRQGLVLDMTFDQDEAGSGKITDRSGKENNGRAAGVRWTAEGRKGGAYEFAADGDEIVISNNASLKPKQLTLAAWIKTSIADGIWRRIFDKSYSQGFALGMAGDWQQNKWRGKLSMEIGGKAAQISKNTVADGQWHQVVITYDGTTQQLYVDGQPQSKAFCWTGKVPANSFNLVIGCNRSNLKEKDLGTSFRGLIDEPMMWNRALSTNEIAFLYQSQQ
jgi:hypothetical protein